jgi:hypothetical protein
MQEFKLVKESSIASMETFCRRRGYNLINVEDKLQVIELKLRSGRNTFHLHIVMNPWSFEINPPLIEVLNVDLPNASTHLIDSVQRVNEVEGRYRITFTKKCKNEWRKRPDLQSFYQDWVEPALEQVLPDTTFRNLRTTPNTWGLHFPNPMQGHIERLDRLATKKNWQLLTLEESLQHLSRQRIDAEIESVKLAAKKAKFELSLEQAETSDVIDAIIEEFGGSDVIDLKFPEIKSRIAKRYEECKKNQPAPLNFDDPSYTLDTTFNHQIYEDDELRRF